jgi:hypothetical protein
MGKASFTLDCGTINKLIYGTVPHFRAGAISASPPALAEMSSFDRIMTL